MKIALSIVFCLVLAGLRAQQIYPIKESIDQIEPYYTSGPYDYNNDLPAWWQSWGFNLETYLRMYQITGDKAYLNKFIRHSYNIQQKRNPSAVWLALPDDGTLMLYTGSLLRPMAEFVYIIKNNSNIYNTNLLPGLIPTLLSNPSQSIINYGDYANWLEARVKQTMNAIIANYWIDDSHCFRKTLFSGNNTIEINFNANYASTMFFIGNIDPFNYSDYTYKAEQIVLFFRNRVTEYSPNQSYTWFHDDHNPFREDVSHGASDIQIPLVAYQLYGNGLYQPSEMNKFAHTFTKNIWKASNTFPIFHNNVFEAV